MFLAKRWFGIARDQRESIDIVVIDLPRDHVKRQVHVFRYIFPAMFHDANARAIKILFFANATTASSARGKLENAVRYWARKIFLSSARPITGGREAVEVSKLTLVVSLQRLR